MALITDLESRTVTRLTDQIPYFRSANKGLCRGVADIATFLNVNTVPAPAALVVFDGERAQDNESIGGIHQPTLLYWSVYVVASNFDSAGDGRIGSQGVYQMIDDVVAALQGYLINSTPFSKMFFIASSRHDVDKTVIYRVQFRCNHIRSTAA